MTSHERLNCILKHQRADRLPMDLIWPRQETLDALRDYFGVDDVEGVFRKLDIDFRWIPLSIQYPEFERRVNNVLKGPAPGSGQAYIFHDDRTFENAWGVMQRLGEDGKYLEWCGGPLVDSCSLNDWTPPPRILPPVSEIRQRLNPVSDTITVVEIAFPFKLAWHLCGLEGLLMNMVIQPDFVDELYDVLYAHQTEEAVLAARAGYDVIAVVGDVAGQLGMLFSPRLFDRFDRPRLKTLIQRVKRENPDVHVLYHSDGNMKAIIPALIDCGIDILNPIQSACMDPAQIKQEFGDALTFHGTISVQDTVPNGSRDDVVREVRQRIQTVGYNGGFILSPENSIPFDAPLENVLAIYDTAREYDYSGLPATI